LARNPVFDSGARYEKWDILVSLLDIREYKYAKKLIAEG
jgi:hypothetical protein